MEEGIGGYFMMTMPPPPAEPGVWTTKPSELAFNRAIRDNTVVFTDKMVSWEKDKRLVIKVENSLDQIMQIQVIGDIVDSFALPVNIGAPAPCPANGQISIGLDWDDWLPYIGVRITPAGVPTRGILKIWIVQQG